MIAHAIVKLFAHPDPRLLLLIAGKTALVYLFLIFGLRLMGKRELGQMNISDLVLIIVLANSVQNAMVGDDTTLDGGLVAAATLLVMNRIFTIIMGRSRKIEHLLVGDPLMIFHDGHLMKDRMLREGLTREQVMAALREHGFASLDQVRTCILEVDGTISVVPKEGPVYRTRHHFRALRMP